MTMNLKPASYDVVVTLEVLAHVADQAGFMRRIASLLKPGGQLLLATQNKPVLLRSEGVAPVAEGQIRNWVDRRDLRKLLETYFLVEDMFSICPHGHLGFLRYVNSVKLNRAASLLLPSEKIDSLKERLWLGHTLMAAQNWLIEADRDLRLEWPSQFLQSAATGDPDVFTRRRSPGKLMPHKLSQFPCTRHCLGRPCQYLT